MSRILYITNGMASTLNSSFELSHLLVAEGHEVTYVSHAAVGDKVASHGHPFIELTRDRLQAEILAADPRPPKHRPLALAQWARRRRALRRASLADRQLEQIIEDIEPDLLLIDMEMHAALIVTAGLGIPTMLPIVWFTVFRDARIPPMHTTLRPEAGALTLRKAWARNRLSAIKQRFRERFDPAQLIEPVSWNAREAGSLRALARSRHYDVRRRTDGSQWLRPWGYRDLPVLSFNVAEMDFPHDPHPDLHYVGPMVDRTRREPELDAVSQAAWSDYLSHRAAAADPRPMVYCSLGSHWSADSGFLRRVVDAFERRPEWDLVLGLGSTLDPAHLGETPDNVWLLPWAPQLEVLELADCAITHGGITTINECIAYGVPMVAYSTGFVDQNGCAARVEFHRLGVRADRDTDGPAEIAANVERALHDPQIRQNVDAMRATFRAYEDRQAPLRAIEGSLRPIEGDHAARYLR